jgi:Neuraminidase (sialidase)
MSISTDDGATWTTPEINTQWDDFANNIFFSRVKNKFVVTNIGSNSNVVSYSTNGAVGNWSTTSTLPANVTFIVESATRVYGGNTAGIIVDLTNLI